MLARTERKVYRVYRQSNLGDGIELKFPIIGILSTNGQLLPGALLRVAVQLPVFPRPVGVPFIVSPSTVPT